MNTGSCSSYDSCYRATTDGCTTNLNDLDLDYVDMIMLDYPSRAGCDAILGQWMAFEDMLKAGGTKALVRQHDTKSLMCDRNVYTMQTCTPTIPRTLTPFFPAAARRPPHTHAHSLTHTHSHTHNLTHIHTHNQGRFQFFP